MGEGAGELPQAGTDTAGHGGRGGVGYLGTAHRTKTAIALFQGAPAWKGELPACENHHASVAEVTYGAGLACNGQKTRDVAGSSTEAKDATNRDGSSPAPSLTPSRRSGPCRLPCWTPWRSCCRRVRGFLVHVRRSTSRRQYESPDVRTCFPARLTLLRTWDAVGEDGGWSGRGTVPGRMSG